jgi:hypothetical protein
MIWSGQPSIGFGEMLACEPGDTVQPTRSNGVFGSVWVGAAAWVGQLTFGKRNNTDSVREMQPKHASKEGTDPTERILNCPIPWRLWTLALVKAGRVDAGAVGVPFGPTDDGAGRPEGGNGGFSSADAG